MIRELLHIDRARVNLRVAAGALLAVLIAEVLEKALGIGLVQSGLAAFLVLAAGRSGELRTRLTHMGVVTIVGGAFGLLAYLSGDVAWQAALVLAVIAYATGLAYGYGAAAGNAGFLLLLWALAVQIGTAEGADPPATAAAFLVGGAVAMLVMTVLAGLRLVDAAPAGPQDAASTPAPDIGTVVTSGVGIWSLVRAVLILIAVVIGYQITRALDPFWVAIVVLVVFLPEADKTTFKAIQRGTGTLAGAVAGTAVLALAPSEVVVLASMLVAGLFAVAFYSANYLIYAFFLTAAIVFYEWFAAGEQLGAGGERLLAAVIGLVLAGIGVWLMGALRSSGERASSSPG